MMTHFYWGILLVDKSYNIDIWWCIYALANSVIIVSGATPLFVPIVIIYSTLSNKQIRIKIWNFLYIWKFIQALDPLLTL